MESSAADHRRGQGCAAQAQELPGEERTHRVPQQEIRKLRVQITGEHLERPDVLDQCPVAILLTGRVGFHSGIVIVSKITKVILVSIADRTTVAQQVTAGYNETVRCHVGGKIIVPVNEFLHAVDDLEHAAHGTSLLRYPPKSPDLGLVIC